MSHNKERKEKVCLNCNSPLHGRYCHVCGQENIEPKETVWGLISHFAYDITHFDGKFFSSVRYLLTKPGFLSQEFIRGRRAAYLHPIRMYVFTASFFFIIFFSIFKPSGLLGHEKDKEEQLKELTEARNILSQSLTGTRDSVVKTAMERSIVKIDREVDIMKRAIGEKKTKDSVLLSKKQQVLDSVEEKVPGLKGLSKQIASQVEKPDSIYENDTVTGPRTNFKLDGFKFRNQIGYDAVQQELPERMKDNWFERLMSHRAIALDTKWKNDKKEAIALFMEKFMHTLPQALFISLPAFALILLMLYARRKFYYVDHGIFTIHFYCASFLLLLIYFGIDKLESATGWSWISVIKALLFLGIFFYLYKAMRKFYRQGRIKTILKFLILNFFALILFVLLTLVFFLLSLVQFS